MIRFAFIFSLLLAAPAAFAQTLDSTHKDWSVYSHNGSCYIASAPTTDSGNFASRGEAYTLIVHRGAKTDEINVSSGYPYKDKDEVVVKIDGKQFKLFSKENVAWAYDARQDAAIVAAMKNGNRMTVRGTSAKGTWSEDTYSLSGISAAYKRMKAMCK